MPDDTRAEVAVAWQHLWDAHGGTNCSECMPLVEAAIRADRPTAVNVLVDAARAMSNFQLLVDSGQTVFPLDPNHPGSMGNTYVRVIDSLRAALIPFEESA